jgi:hypothetical protein
VGCEERTNALLHDLTTQAFEPAPNPYNRRGAGHKDQIAGSAPDHFSEQLADGSPGADDAEIWVIEIVYRVGVVADSLGVTFDKQVHLLDQLFNPGVGKELATHLPLSYGRGWGIVCSGRFLIYHQGT